MKCFIAINTILSTATTRFADDGACRFDPQLQLYYIIPQRVDGLDVDVWEVMMMGVGMRGPLVSGWALSAVDSGDPSTINYCSS